LAFDILKNAEVAALARKRPISLILDRQALRRIGREGTHQIDVSGQLEPFELAPL